MFMPAHDQSAKSPSAHASEASGQHLLLYDGVCGLCDRTISFVLPRDPAGLFRFAALQSPFGRDQLVRHGHNPDVLTTFFVIENYRSASPRLLAGARAALFVAQHLRNPWKYARLARILPNFVLDAVYTLVARNRYFLFGKLDRCVSPNKAYKDRFIEEE
jgi:predicted DCC family thiol-disulfide oxidoreductase YuxK